MKNVSEFRITVRPDSTSKDAERFLHHWRLEFDDSVRSVSFMFVGDECRRALAGEIGAVADISHMCKIDLASLWTFFDVPCPTLGNGQFTTDYRRIEICREIREELRAAIEVAERQWRTQPENKYGDRDDVTIDLAHRLPEWRTWYQGAGKGEFDTGGDPLTADKLAFWMEDESFAQCAERLLAIARNKTTKPDDVGVCKISWRSNWEEFSFFVGGMSGGIINHGNADKPDWSIHT